MAQQTAKEFANTSPDHTAIVLKPGAIYGKRHLRNGKVIALDWFMRPLSLVMPWQFASVNAIGACITSIIEKPAPYTGKFTIIKNSDIR